jgi:hypothetical protein
LQSHFESDFNRFRLPGILSMSVNGELKEIREKMLLLEENRTDQRLDDILIC